MPVLPPDKILKLIPSLFEINITESQTGVNLFRKLEKWDTIHFLYVIRFNTLYLF